MINWIKSRIGERTSWDGGAMIVMGLIALFATNFIKMDKSWTNVSLLNQKNNLTQSNKSNRA